jgi:predicted NBD/HSP70 family sugar kinase
MSTIGNQEMVRITNQRLILNLIKEKGTISRADIAKILNLSPPSTSSNINQLINMDFIREIGEGVSAGGRKPIMLELNRNYGYIVGVDMSTEEVKVVLGSIYAEVIDTAYFKIREDEVGITLLIDIIESLNFLYKKNNIHKDKIKVIMIAAPGVYDKTTNKIVSSRFPGWDDIDIIGALAAEFNSKVIFKNDIGTAAYGEYKFGIKQNCKNLLFINADISFGAGLVINGELYEGTLGSAGMVGKTVFSKEQVGGIYKRNGYLETSVSTVKLVQRIKNKCKNDKSLLE